jgi:RNA polymerase sigma factor (sigma-70 family)
LTEAENMPGESEMTYRVSSSVGGLRPVTSGDCGPANDDGNPGPAMLKQAEALGQSGLKLRASGDEESAQRCFRAAVELALKADENASGRRGLDPAGDALLPAARWSLECGDADIARQLVDKFAARHGTSSAYSDYEQLRDIGAWPDRWLVAAIRSAPPDKLALDELAHRHWKMLFGRCQLLTLNREKAADLAQDAWCRVLRGHRALKPGGNFPAYIAAIATNLWRDNHRYDKRAGALGEHRVTSLDLDLPSDSGPKISLSDVIPDLASLEGQERQSMKQDIDYALGQLDPLLREILIARYIEGESCAEIGQRHRRTEQTISGWVRRGIQQMKIQLQALRGDTRGKQA